MGEQKSVGLSEGEIVCKPGDKCNFDHDVYY